VSEVRVRRADIADAGALAPLVRQLGYEASPAQMQARLARLLDDSRNAVLVAELESAIVGMATACMDYGVQQDAVFGRITAAVVDTEARGQGIGAMLIGHIEAWCRERGADRVTLTSASHRADAHKFYARLGYDQTGVRFIKQIR
jgi:GNAT superfamily N-acetyltransferase